MQCWHILVVNNLWWKLVWKKIHKLNDPNLNDDVQQVALVFLRFWKKPRRSQQTHKYVLFQRPHNVSYFMNINAFIYVILLIGQKSICSTILTVTYSNIDIKAIYIIYKYIACWKNHRKKEFIINLYMYNQGYKL